MKNCLRIKYFPISAFSILLGLFGFTIVIQKISEIFFYTKTFGNITLIVSIFLFFIVTIFYTLKIIFHLDEVKREFNNNIKLQFFPTFSISLILMSIALMNINIHISFLIWAIGSLIQLLITIKILSIWIKKTSFEIKHINPAWFIPIVGNILVPIAGVTHANQHISWFFFSVGIVFWIALFSMVMNRIIFHHPIDKKLIPTLFILIAPPAVAMISYTKLNGELSNFSYIMYYFAIFMTMFLITQFKTFTKIKFFLSWWAYSFPISTITIASILMFKINSEIIFKYIGVFLFILLCILIFILIYKTFFAIKRKEICVEE
ncbi:MAG TPA: SLAC1 anion channel family protein [Candidatus Absconditabacterales bacterium]|nr:SLAC1 anion channel family protein [Candidatus Absconditabacterales bacterium]